MSCIELCLLCRGLVSYDRCDRRNDMETRLKPLYLQALAKTEESTSRLDSSVPLTHHDPKDLGLICLAKKRKIYFRILSDFKIQSWIFLEKHTLRLSVRTRKFHTNRSKNRPFYSYRSHLGLVTA